MVNYSSLQDKIIIVAEHEEDSAQKLIAVLTENGFQNIRIAEDGSKVYEILRPFYNRPEQIGLVIINDQLPQCQVREMCLSLSCATDGSIIPFIVLSKEIVDPHYFCAPDNSEAHNQCLTQAMQYPLNYHELLLLVGFQLNMKHERFLRHKQEERLINELAERKVVDSKLKYLVVHDELTGLYNRNNFERQLRLILNRGKDLTPNGALLFIDVDRFSMINELEGFEVGDRLLVELVVLIRKFVSAKNLFARIGSDEFCLFLENKNEGQVLTYAEKIKKAVEEFRFFTGEVCYSISISIGISTLNAASHIYHPSELVLRARQACNNAKENGRNMLWLFNENDVAVKERRRDIYWVPLIKKALLEKELFLVYQPVVALSSGEISHYEALIRMKGEDDVVISPNQFIPAAERMGLIHSIDLWVVETAIDFLAGLPADMSHVSLAINLSSTAFQETKLLQTIRDKLELTWVDAKRLTFEITETAAFQNYEKARDMIIKIRALGCKFALDDFGAGFCSFNYLKSFPVDYVKIDGQFIQNLNNDETDQVLVKSMAEIAARLGKKTIAEFVETPTTIKKLKEYGIDFGQGYIFGKPEINLLQSNSMSIMNLMQPPPTQGPGMAEQIPGN
ncbi:EAL domain-containing protein [Methylomarinum sp. Ch1-1]|uniref:EAL domain-containing protein n=1 Tax=Methylomarinum roseum TaxID=3067653 RepID=A0AAU7NR89_9GAMM|nr:GGDEF and EAL domain-containing protein [Methylomarinum sp. Ch1-1]MDP4520528.1 EAL domain-containing protein [Methylomarinum sp. Ch1-1]